MYKLKKKRIFTNQNTNHIERRIQIKMRNNILWNTFLINLTKCLFFFFLNFISRFRRSSYCTKILGNNENTIDTQNSQNIQKMNKKTEKPLNAKILFTKLIKMFTKN